MPTILVWKGFRFFFFSNEGLPLEPPHIHVRKDRNLAKFWLDPVSLADSWGMTAKELNTLELQVEKNVSLFRSKWDEYFGKASQSD